MTETSPEDPRDALIREQAARIAAQDELVTVLEALVAELRERLDAALRAGSRNSGNSSMPPGSDDLPGRKPPRKERRAAEKKYVHGAFTELYSAFHLGTRSIEPMKQGGVLPYFAGIVVSDRYQGYFSTRSPGTAHARPPPDAPGPADLAVEQK